MLECQSVSFEVKYSPTPNYLRIRSLSEASCDDTFTLTGKQAQTNKQTPGESELPPPGGEERRPRQMDGFDDIAGKISIY